MFFKVFQLHADFLKAMAHPKRLEILNLLRDNKMCVSEMQEMLGLPQSNLSQHLQILRDSKVVSTHKEGKQVYYQIAHPNILKASDLVRDLLIKQCNCTLIKKALCKDFEQYLPIVEDPVCKMRLLSKSAAHSYQHDGDTYFFCATGCLEKFKKNPNKYIKRKT